jgi:purine-binding chemotaxis protein CheW
MRALPIRPIAGAPRFISGVAIIRGSPVPVVDAALLLGEDERILRRLVTLDTGDRPVALAVGDVLGVRLIETAASDELPPLLRAVDGDAVRAIRVLDNELLLLLRTSRLVPEGVLKDLDTPGAAS